MPENDANVLTLHKQEPVKAVVTHLKFLLAQAESGELRGFIYVARDHEGYQRGRFGMWPDDYAMIGAADVLKEEIYRDIRTHFEELPLPEGD